MAATVAALDISIRKPRRVLPGDADPLRSRVISRADAMKKAEEVLKTHGERLAVSHSLSVT